MDSEMQQRAYISLGSNLGDRRQTLRGALTMLENEDRVEVVCVSTFIETDPVGGPPGQTPYLNAAAEIETDLSPEDLLSVLQRIESALGRDRPSEQRWGPRTCDLDILLMGDCVMETDSLTIPHPRLVERAFALRPLASIAPEVVHPVLGKTAAALLAELEGRR